jgi:hypothetical protein
MTIKNFFPAGKLYFYNQNGKLQMGELQYCETCGKPCHVNAVTISPTASRLITSLFNSDMDDSGDMYYNEITGLNTCKNC